MIAAQRAFQANSKTLTTADSLLAELMQLKR
jgi:flagellar hook protein FlgE